MWNRRRRGLLLFWRQNNLTFMFIFPSESGRFQSCNINSKKMVGRHLAMHHSVSIYLIPGYRQNNLYKAESKQWRINACKYIIDFVSNPFDPWQKPLNLTIILLAFLASWSIKESSKQIIKRSAYSKWRAVRGEQPVTASWDTPFVTWGGPLEYR